MWAERGFDRHGLGPTPGVTETGLKSTDEPAELSGWGADIDAPLREAWVLVRRGAVDEALAAIDRYEQEAERSGRADSCVARVLSARLDVLAYVDRNDAVVSLADGIHERFEQSDEPVLREAVASALLEKAYALGRMRRVGETVAAYEALHEYPEEVLSVVDREIALIDAKTDPVGAQRLAPRLLLRASLLSTLDRDDESSNVFGAVIEQFSSSDDEIVLAMVEHARQARMQLAADD